MLSISVFSAETSVTLNYTFFENKLNKNSEAQIAWKIRKNYEHFEAKMKIY